MDFQDFPMILGNLGVETDQPPKMCAGLGQRTGNTLRIHGVVEGRPFRVGLDVAASRSVYGTLGRSQG